MPSSSVRCCHICGKQQHPRLLWAAVTFWNAATHRRQFALGELLPAPLDGAAGWTLPQVVERMRRSYCGTLAVELDHLYSSVRSRCRATSI